MPEFHARWPRLFGALGPAIGAIPPVEAARGGLGALVGLGVAALLALTPGADLGLGLAMVAPFGATAVLIFAVPNSPLAQPWSAVVGNTLSALVGVAVVLAVPDPILRIALATGLAIVAMSLARAVHPPGGAVAMTAALNPETVHDLGFGFALAPVALGTALLVAIAVAYARATGRRYPFRQAPAENAHGTADPPALQRLGPTREELEALLRAFDQSANVGVADLSRLIAAAETLVASHRLHDLTCAGIMSRDLVTAGPETPLHAVADLFRRHGFASLPVVDTQGRLLGMIFQIHLIRRGREDALRLGRSFGAAMRRLLDAGWTASGRGATAGEVMAVGLPRVTTGTPVSALPALLADGAFDAIPVVENGRLVGIVTRTDLIAAMATAGLASRPAA